jgi:hypothetical protein
MLSFPSKSIEVVNKARWRLAESDNLTLTLTLAYFVV